MLIHSLRGGRNWRILVDKLYEGANEFCARGPVSFAPSYSLSTRMRQFLPPRRLCINMSGKCSSAGRHGQLGSLSNKQGYRAVCSMSGDMNSAHVDEALAKIDVFIKLSSTAYGAPRVANRRYRSLPSCGGSDLVRHSQSGGMPKWSDTDKPL